MKCLSSQQHTFFPPSPNHFNWSGLCGWQFIFTPPSFPAKITSGTVTVELPLASRIAVTVKEETQRTAGNPRVKDNAIKSRNAVPSLDTSRVLERSDFSMVALRERIHNEPEGSRMLAVISKHDYASTFDRSALIRAGIR